MRHAQPLLVAIASLAVLLEPPTVSAQGLPAHEVKPIVLLLLDSSGSMEYDTESPGVEIGDADDFLEPPTCSPVEGESGRSRFIVAVEVLTGNFDHYYCEEVDRSTSGSGPCPREDCPYPVPHIQPFGDQASDGLIDRSIESFKFGVMTFDVKSSPAVNEGGAYSYGNENGTNYGARNEVAPTGGFVHPSLSDDPDDVRARNELVQQSITSTIPYGGTPIAPLLYDALYYFQNDPEILTDPYRECRPKTVILFTDGRANLGEDEAPYLGSVAQAQALRDAGVNVYVIGYRLADGVSSQAQAIATNNGALDMPYFRADNSVDLVRAFTQILGNLSVATQSRTRTVVTNETGNPVDVQYQFNAAHAKVRDASGLGWIPGLRQGILERSVYQCGQDEDQPGASALALVQRLSDLLNTRTDADRDIFTVVAGRLEEFLVGNTAVTPELLGVPAPEQAVPDFSRDPMTGQCRSGFLEGSREERVAAWRRNLVEYVRADDASCRRGYKTGAIDHGTPVVQGRLEDVDLMIPSFREYKEVIANRPVMLYAPTHDGLLHAFRVDRQNGNVQNPEWGREDWAFVPPHLLARLPELPNGRRTLLDGTPVVKDVLFSRTLGNVALETAAAWHSVLLVGDRDGGRGLSALDVTDPRPDHWEFLWDVSAEKGRCVEGQASCNLGGDTAFVNDYRRMGRTWGRPEIGTVQICPDNTSTCGQSTLEEVAVAVVPGGSGEGLAAGTGRTVFVIRLDTGEKLAEFASGGLNVDNSCTGVGRVIDADMVGSVTCYSTFPGTFMSRCFLGDEAGRLWRLELGSPGIPNWNLTMFYDPYKSLLPFPPVDSPIRSPAFEAPALAVQGGKNLLVIVYGSGEMDSLDCSLEAALRRDFVVSLTESVEDYPLAVEPTRTCSPWDDSTCRKIYPSLGRQIGASVNWKKFLGYDADLNLEQDALPCERMMGPPVIFSSVAYFTTFTPDDDVPCSPGIGRLYGAAFDRHDADCADLVPLLPDPDDPAGYVLSEQVGTQDTGAIPYGLAVVTRPACNAGAAITSGTNPGTTDGGSAFAGIGAPPPQIVVQTGVQSEPPKETPTQGGTQRSINEASRTIRRAVESIYVSSWGNLLD